MKRSLICALLGVALWSGVAAAALAPTKPSQILNLYNSGATSCGGVSAVVDRIVKPDGTSAAFSIPTGQVLIVTSVDWVAASVTANRHWEFVLGFPGGSFSLGDGAQSDADGQVSGTLLVPGGLVVKSGVQLCPHLTRNGGDAFAAVRVHGFLAKDK